jgi:hypothetical protein
MVIGTSEGHDSRHWNQTCLYPILARPFRLGELGILAVKKLYPEIPCGGWGILHNETEIIEGLSKIGGLDPSLSGGPSGQF